VVLRLEPRVTLQADTARSQYALERRKTHAVSGRLFDAHACVAAPACCRSSAQGRGSRTGGAPP
jgi:hypothetical protein